ncbi:hypothetical protein [Halomonas llamarensis]|uniref:Sulfotransferase family protein n=1 Tax=Halomonas llamarensis TaxID=2945104 RepID=A0ABT0SLC6_9GAMM|nr:hypothetical protein [Halomonas llamarensis]MCL7928589.1 hypothetical protein [Halomonas llamarensis]
MIKNDKNIIFTITHGRTGTTMLTEVFKIFDDTRSEHEPEPNYANVLPYVKENPRYAIEFLEKKIKAVNAIKEKNYVETSNVFGKGFFIPLIRMGFYPNLIFLNRDFRKVAESLFKRGSFPMRTKMGQHFSADPSFPGTLPIFQPEALTDYQICFWGVLDSFWRQIRAAEIYDEEGCKYVWASASDFNDFDKTVEMGEYLGLSIKNKEESRLMHEKKASVHHNPNRSSSRAEEVSIRFDEEEREVIDRIAFYEPFFVNKVINSSYFDKNLAKKLM